MASACRQERESEKMYHASAGGRSIREAEHGLNEGNGFGFGDVLDSTEGESLGKVGAVIVALGGKNA